MERVSKVLQTIPKDSNNKIYGLGDSYENFYNEYPFVNFDQ